VSLLYYAIRLRIWIETIKREGTMDRVESIKYYAEHMNPGIMKLVVKYDPEAEKVEKVNGNYQTVTYRAYVDHTTVATEQALAAEVAESEGIGFECDVYQLTLEQWHDIVTGVVSVPHLIKTNTIKKIGE
jgi:hypothetical protein